MSRPAESRARLIFTYDLGMVTMDAVAGGRGRDEHNAIRSTLGLVAIAGIVLH